MPACCLRKNAVTKRRVLGTIHWLMALASVQGNHHDHGDVVGEGFDVERDLELPVLLPMLSIGKS